MRTGLILMAALLLGGAAIYLLGGDSDTGTSSETGSAASNAAPPTTDSTGAAPLEAARSPSANAAESSDDDSPAPSSDAGTAIRKALSKTVSAIRPLLVDRENLSDTDRTLLKDHLSALRNAARSLDGAHALLTMLDAEEDPNTAIRLGRALRHSRYEEIATRLALVSSESPSPRARRAAVIALELRPPAQWYEAVTKAYRSDEDGQVREEAANLLGRSLRDRQQESHHEQVRSALRDGLSADDADHRLRTLTALMAEPTPSDAMRAAVEDLEDDEDGRVAREATAVLRIWARIPRR